jgi:hypothetical protein
MGNVTALAQLFIGLATLITAVVNVWNSLRNRRAIEAVREQSNGNQKTLVKEVRAAAFKAGAQSEIDKERQE